MENLCILYHFDLSFFINWVPYEVIKMQLSNARHFIRIYNKLMLLDLAWWNHRRRFTWFQFTSHTERMVFTILKQFNLSLIVFLILAGKIAFQWLEIYYTGCVFLEKATKCNQRQKWVCSRNFIKKYITENESFLTQVEFPQLSETTKG